MTGIKENTDNYYLARVNKETGDKTFLYYSRVRDVFIEAFGFEEATRYDSFEAVNQLIQAQNSLAEMNDSEYYYFCCKLHATCTELDGDGNPFNHNDLINGKGDTDEQPND